MAIRVRLVGRPPEFEIERGPGVADAFWYALPSRLGARQVRGRDSRLRVPVERFLAARLWLRDHCQHYGVEVDFGEAERDLLRRANNDNAFLRARMHDSSPESDATGAVAEPSQQGSRFTRPLREFQERDLAKLMGLLHGANFSVPGAGKTAVAYALYEAERVRDRVQRLLVVAPISAFEAWEVEATRCFGSPPVVRRFDGTIPWDAEVLLVNYQKLKEPYFADLTAWALEAPTQIILDEAHRMKRGMDGEWGRACLQLAPVAVRRDILTGTPAPQSARDFVALVNFLWPNQARTVLPAAALDAVPPPGAIELVSQALHPLFVRTTKAELGLLPPTITVEWVRLEGLQADIYDALRNRYAGMFDLSRTDRTMLAQMGDVTMYLLEAATNPGLLSGRTPDQGAIPFRYPSLAIPPGSQLAELIAHYHRHEIPSKFKKLGAMVRDNAVDGRKTLVWSNFVGNLLTLERMLAPYKPALVYGGVPSFEGEAAPGVRTRERELQRFRIDPDCMVLLANPAAVGEGISLHEVCHDAVYLDRTFNAGQYLQSVDRIHRLGLAPDAETRVTILLTQTTIDERVDSRVAEKSRALGVMLDDRGIVEMALPDEDDYGEAIEDVGDLEALFAHLRGDDV